MKITFDIVGPNNLEEGTNWDVLVTFGAPGNKFVLARQGGYKQRASVIKTVKKMARSFRTKVDGQDITLEAIITDHRTPRTRTTIEEKELRKKV